MGEAKRRRIQGIKTTDAGQPIVPWSQRPGTHPLMIACEENKAMGCWDLIIQLGAFPSRAAAKAYADDLVKQDVFSDVQRIS